MAFADNQNFVSCRCFQCYLQELKFVKIDPFSSVKSLVLPYHLLIKHIHKFIYKFEFMRSFRRSGHR